MDGITSPVIDTMLRRNSVRAFDGRPIDDATERALLRAGMSGPSCVNARDWSFLTIRDRDTLCRMADANGRPADPLRTAALGILVCGDLSRAFPRAKEYWVIDGAIAAQNMILAAESLGIGSVWLGTWPQQERVAAQSALFSLPEHIVPHSIIAFGYPAPDAAPRFPSKPVFEADRVHRERW